MTDQTQSKIVAVVDHEKAQKHTWLVTKIGDDNHPAESKGYEAGMHHYALMEAGSEASGHDLFKLRRETSMTEREFDFLRETKFDALADGETYETKELGF